MNESAANNNNNTQEIDEQQQQLTKDTDTVRATICVVLTSIAQSLSLFHLSSYLYPCSSLSWQLIKSTNKRTSTKIKPRARRGRWKSDRSKLTSKLAKK